MGTLNGIVEDFRQGGIGDCWYLASIKALSTTDAGRTILANTINITATTCSVSFAGAPVYTYNTTQTTITTEINDGDNYNKTGGHSSDDPDVLLLEMALKNYTINRSPFFTSSVYTGGWMTQALSLFTGKASVSFYSTNVDTISSKLDELAEIIDHAAITASTTSLINPSLDIPGANHAYSIMGIDTVNKTVSFRNPWNSSSVLQDISYANFAQYFPYIQYLDFTTNNMCLYAANKGGSLTGGTGNDWLYGGAGNNILNGGTGVDRMYGAGGNDTYYVDETNDIVIESYNQGIDIIYASASYDMRSSMYVDNLTLTGTADIYGYGNDLANIITGNTGNNTLYGFAGADKLNGLTGADTMYGGLGSDTYYIDDAGDVANESYNQGIDTVISDISYTLSLNFENLTLAGITSIDGTGNTLNNTIKGNIANNILNGGTGIDKLYGGLGNDTYYVDISTDTAVENLNAGTDKVISSASYTLGVNVENLELTGTGNITGKGNTLANTITGNSGNNLLVGNIGNDTLQGGDGNDTYNFNLGNGRDTISDSQGFDIINFGKTVLKTTIAFFQSGLDLICAYSGTNRITIQNHFNEGNEIDKFMIYGGNYLTSSDINQVIQNVTAYASEHNISLTRVEDVTANSSLKTIIANSWHS